MLCEVDEVYVILGNYCIAESDCQGEVQDLNGSPICECTTDGEWYN